MPELKLSLVILLLAIAQIDRCAFAQEQATDPRIVPLPAQDPAVQQMLDSLIQPKTVRSFSTTIGDIIEAREQGKITDEVWLTQCVVFVSKLGSGRNDNDLMTSLLVNSRLTPVTQDYLRIDPLVRVKILAPYLENPQTAVAASEVIGGDQIWMPMIPPYDITGIGELNVFGGYLLSCAPADPSWALVRSAYGLNPDAAFRTALKVYFFDKDRAAYERAENLRKELLSLALSYDVANKQQKLELDQKLLGKLDELADYPHWCVRGYVLGVIERGINSALAGRAQWVKETAVPQRLKKDKNPFVSAFAKGVSDRINQAK